jgi:hypothetical protein
MSTQSQALTGTGSLTGTGQRPRRGERWWADLRDASGIVTRELVTIAKGPDKSAKGPIWQVRVGDAQRPRWTREELLICVSEVEPAPGGPAVAAPAGAAKRKARRKPAPAPAAKAKAPAKAPGPGGLAPAPAPVEAPPPAPKAKAPKAKAPPKPPKAGKVIALPTNPNPYLERDPWPGLAEAEWNARFDALSPVAQKQLDEALAQARPSWFGVLTLADEDEDEDETGPPLPPLPCSAPGCSGQGRYLTYVELTPVCGACAAKGVGQ